MSGKISEKEIQDTFYNLMLEVVFDDVEFLKDKNMFDPDVIRYLTKQTILKACSYPRLETLSGKQIVLTDLPLSHIELFVILNKIKQQYAIKKKYTEHTHKIIDMLVDDVMKKQTFLPMFQKINSFFKQNMNDAKEKKVSVEAIRETFYSNMVEQVLINNIVSKEDLEDREPYIFFALSSNVVFQTIINNLNTRGTVHLINGANVTKQNCPQEFSPLFDIVFMIKDKMKEMKLSDDQIRLVRICSSQNENQDVPDDLKELQTREIMNVVGMITEISIRISQIKHFKDIIDDVIKFCLEAQGGK
ncbi:MAG: hypothetical protein Dasosvirus2_5 [Dasosvirus sp.]|uniref:Uncharacterized protein n=1 Tax=Dasosvirus sp. TaxID=2487764 RepID=A0A3G4ZVE9_9VIRU|nr:MAG: hypothetical protein Dasosvirus2_5 [Dasosvirus sp.]